MSSDSPTLIPFCISLLVHFLLALLILESRQPRALPEVFDVSISTELVRQNLEKRKNQLVSPSMRSEQKPPEDTPLRSDADSGVTEQQIRQGDGRDYGAIPQQAVKQAPQAQPPAPPQKISPPVVSKPPPQTAPFKGGKLDLSSSSDIIEQIARQGAKPNSNTATSTTGNQEPAPFSRAANQNARFLGQFGDSDLITGIKEGDITLLNAKASKYAVFVRRVAARVFHLVKEYGWSYVKQNDYQSLDNFTLVRASMDRNGKLVEVRFEESSGSTNFDNVLVRAVEGGLGDPHPPSSAALADGNIHFIFMARSWSQMAPDRVGVSERRWLLLKTGLE
ncbi:MAG: TonB C-terminal domain-containing protein [Bdellovibrionales bacterium]|nr:TonB C-terminal domain-containing protein [Bdellovibrionales bacterium]